MDPLATVVARRFQAGAAVKVFHGTTHRAAQNIRREGLTSNLGYDRPQWYMVAADFESAAHHAAGHDDVGFVVIEFRVPTEPKLTEDGRKRTMWPGYPYLWNPVTISWEGTSTRWFALKQPLPPSLIVKVHAIAKDQ